MITPLEIYWILQLDSIGGFFLAASFLLGAVSLVLFLVFAYCSSQNPDEWSGTTLKSSAENAKARAPAVKKSAVRATVAFVACTLIACLLPSTKTAAAMIIAPKIINSPTVRHEAGDLYKLAKQALENAVAPDHKAPK